MFGVDLDFCLYFHMNVFLFIADTCIVIEVHILESDIIAHMFL